MNADCVFRRWPGARYRRLRAAVLSLRERLRDGNQENDEKLEPNAGHYDILNRMLLPTRDYEVLQQRWPSADRKDLFVYPGLTLPRLRSGQALGYLYAAASQLGKTHICQRRADVGHRHRLRLLFARSFAPLGRSCLFTRLYGTTEVVP